MLEKLVVLSNFIFFIDVIRIGKFHQTFGNVGERTQMFKEGDWSLVTRASSDIGS